MIKTRTWCFTLCLLAIGGLTVTRSAEAKFLINLTETGFDGTSYQNTDQDGNGIVEGYIDSRTQYLTEEGVSENWITGSSLGLTYGTAEFRFSRSDIGSSGTGLIDPFLNIQGPGSAAFEQGFNHDGATKIYNESLPSTDSLQIAAVPTYNFTGTRLREFLLDINEPTGGIQEFISLNQIQIFATTAAVATGTGAGSLSDAASSTITQVGGNIPTISFDPSLDMIEVFRLSDAAINYEVMLDASIGAGGGSGTFNARFYFQDLLSNVGAQYTNLVVYSHFGTPPGTAGVNSGFEEWSVADARTALVPEPGSILLLSMTSLGFGWRVRRRKRQAGATS